MSIHSKAFKTKHPTIFYKKKCPFFAPIFSILGPEFDLKMTRFLKQLF